MTQDIQIHAFEEVDFHPLLEMGSKLWPDFESPELRKLLSASVASDKQVIWMAKVDSEAIGFTIFSIRTDYVEGATKSPTGYLEGIYIKPSFRKMGIAKRLIQLGETWCKTKGCSQIGSDTWLKNIESRDFHKRIGFWEEEELVHFLKDL